MTRWLMMLSGLALVTTVPMSSLAHAQVYKPGIGYVEEDEWYDPSDWFDGNRSEIEDLRGDDYWEDEYSSNAGWDNPVAGPYEYEYNVEDGQVVWDERDERDTWDNYYTNDWFDDEPDFDNWY